MEKHKFEWTKVSARVTVPLEDFEREAAELGLSVEQYAAKIERSFNGHLPIEDDATASDGNTPV